MTEMLPRPEQSEATQQGWADLGYRRVGHKRQVLHHGDGRRAVLTDGVDGFGRATERFEVVLLVDDAESLRGQRVAFRKELPSRELWTTDRPRRMGHGPSLCSYVREDDVRAALAEALAV